MTAATVFVFVLLATAAAVGVQATEPTDPIRCWWRTTAAAVAIGEPFDATLTCAAREQEAVRAIPDESRLAAAVIQLAPFEVLGGSHPGDLRTSTHRFFQYHYTLRIIDRDVIGRDARVPDLQIAYRVHTKANGEWVQGRDRTYVMPGQALRVLSLVPVDADDIRDSASEDFARVAGLRFRSRALDIAAVALVLIGAIIAVPAVVRLARRSASLDASGDERASRRVVLAAAGNELSVVAHEVRGGWTPDLAARALNALRLIASCALKRDVAQMPMQGDASAPGRTVASVGLLRRRRIAMSSAVTSLDLKNAIEALPLTAPHEQRQLFEELLQAMSVLTNTLYGNAFNAHDAALDQSVATATTAVQRLKGRR